MDVTELRQRMADLPTLEPAPRFTWQFRRQQLRDKVANDDPANFLRWPIVRESLFTGDTAYIRSELEELSLLYADWFLDLLRSPDFGNPDRGGLGTTDGTFVNQVYALSRFECGGRYPKRSGTVVEFGGGYGAMAYVLRKWGFSGRYVIQDFPELLLLQEYYLSNVGVGDIEFGSEVDKDIDLYIALFSMSEVSPIDRDIPEAKSYLIGYQTEWDGWNNDALFSKFAKDHPDHRWIMLERRHFPNHRYLIGSS